jgi:hypothetical protein
VKAIVQVVNRIAKVYKWEDVAVVYDSEAGENIFYDYASVFFPVSQSEGAIRHFLRSCKGSSQN